MAERDAKEKWALRRRSNGSHVAYVFGDTDPRSPGLMSRHGQEKAREIAAELIAVGNEVYRLGHTELAERICDDKRRVMDAAGDFMSAERAVSLNAYAAHKAFVQAQGHDAGRLRRAEHLAKASHADDAAPGVGGTGSACRTHRPAQPRPARPARRPCAATDPADDTPIPTAQPVTATARPDAEGIPHLGDTARTAAGSGHDAVIDSGEIDGMSHGLLLAVRTKLGGSLELDPADLATDAMGERAGRFYGVEMVPLGTGRVRLAVVGQHPDPEA